MMFIVTVVNHDSLCALLKDMQVLYSMYKAVAVTIIYMLHD